MEPAEIYGRARQEISKWMDRHAIHRHSRGDLPATEIPVLPSPAFFAGGRDQRTLAILERRLPEARARTLAGAEMLLQGRFDVLGYRGLTFGEPIDWQLDPVNGRRAPLQHWSTLDALDSASLGDSKVIWELNRHQWLVRLGQAYRLTGDERFADAFGRHVTEWIEANPRGLGINWASSLEVAFRLIAWCWALHLFYGSRALSADVQARVFGSLASHGAHVEQYLSHYFSPNTHLTGEALGLFYAGVLFPRLAPAARWRELGKRILLDQSEAQILADGVYFEQSTYYQRYTAEIYLHFLILADRSGIDVPAELRERVTRLLDSLLVLLQPNGSMPQIGDADGGWLLPLDVRETEDVRGVYSTAAVIFRREDYAWAAGGLAAETLWLLGPAGAATFDALRPTVPPTSPSRALLQGGYVVLRTSWQEDADQVIFDTGPLGCPHSSGHGHADLLGIQCSFRGQPYVVDPGTFCYTAEPSWRTYFRGTAAHSTVEVDGVGQTRTTAPFAWEAKPRARLLRWGSGDALDFAEAEHHAYARLTRPVVHRRQVILVKRGYCVVVDDLEGDGEHRLDLRFQFAPMPMVLDSDQWARAGRTNGRGLFARAFATIPLTAAIAEGELEPPRGWISRDYGVRTPAPMLLYSMVGSIPVRIVTVLWPADRLTGSPQVSPLVADGTVSGVRADEEREVLRFGREAPSLEKW
jgi:hypothetical protein